MKIRYFLMAVALLSAGQAAAQETYENAKIAGEDLNGTARYVGMGGALDALGADISTIGSNPAGIARFRKSKIVGAVAIVIGVTFVLSLCSGLFIGPLTDWAQNFDFEDAYSAQVFARGLLRGMTIVESLMVLGIGWGIFHRIKTLKH